MPAPHRRDVRDGSASERLSELQREVEAKATEMARLHEQLSFSSEMAVKMRALKAAYEEHTSQGIHLSMPAALACASLTVLGFGMVAYRIRRDSPTHKGYVYVPKDG